MATQALMTAAQFDALPEEEERKYELLDGELLEVPRPNLIHNKVLATLVFIFETFLHANQLGESIPETDFAFGERRLRPDLAILFAATWASVDRYRVPVRVVPDVALEIVSPSESADDLARKTEAYLQAGVREVVHVFPERRMIFVYTAERISRFRAADTLVLETLPGFSTPLAEIFAHI